MKNLLKLSMLSCGFIALGGIFAPGVLAQGNCSVAYTATNNWGNGGQQNVAITNNSQAKNNWELCWTFTSDEIISNLWDGTFTSTGKNICVKNVSYNGTLPANGSVSFGFTYNNAAGANPTNFTLNGVACGGTASNSSSQVIASSSRTSSLPVSSRTSSTLTNSSVVTNSSAAANAARWLLNTGKSELNFVSVKNTDTAEKFTFTQLQGTVSASGQAVLTIPLSSIATGVDLRNTRIQSMLFESNYLPHLHFTTQLDFTALDAMAVGSANAQTLSGNLILHGVSKAISFDALVVKHNNASISFSPRKPIVINSTDFDMNAGIEALRQIVGATTIGEKVPVYFKLFLTRDNPGNLAAITLPTAPATPVGLMGSVSAVTGNASLTWTDISNGESGFLVRRKGADGRWLTATKANANSVSYTDALLTPGTYEYKLISFTESIPSAPTASLPLIYAQGGSSSITSVASSKASAAATSKSSSVRSVSSANSSTATNGDIARGQSLFNSIGCTGCHGTDGKGFYKIDPTKATYKYRTATTQQSLASYINDWMPEGSPSSCVGQCAIDIAAYIRSWAATSSSSNSSVSQITPLPSQAALRKIKNVLTGLAPTEQELTRGLAKKELEAMIDTWMRTPEFQEKMLFFFANAFQQSSISIPDFYGQLRNRPGAFNLAYGIYGDNALPMLFKNMNESFARTALHFAETGRPLTDLLTTDEIMMTTALKSLYMQIEANWDTASDSKVMKWKFNYGRRPALADSLNPNHKDYMVFGHENPSTITSGRTFNDSCNGNSNLVSQYPGNVYLFHLLLGHVGRDTGSGPGQTSTGCWERATKPYFTPSDLSDWKLVKVVRGNRIEPWDLIKLRSSGNSLPSAAPRISFFTTPAFLAVWNTNDSNSHRVTVNQALLAALGQGFTNATQSIPIPPNTAAVDGAHAVSNTECFACHKSLDPMRQFFNNWYFDNDKPKGGTGAGPQPSFGFGNVTGNGRTLVDFGNFLKQVSDESVAGDRVSRFALEMTQKLCFFGNSARCEETDPEMRRIAHEFEDSNFNFKQLISELYSSSLMTANAQTTTFNKNGVTISIVRKDQLCQALSNRLGIDDICKIHLPLRANQSRIGLLAGSLPYDAFSRGVPEPVTPTDPNIFYRGASELLCEAVAALVVDNSQNRLFSSGGLETALKDMVTKVMGLAPNDPKHTAALNILRAHNTAVLAKGATNTNALRSTFSAACQSPSSLGLGI